MTTTNQKPLPAKYIPADHEPEVSRRWDRACAFHADPQRVLSGQAEPYCILIPPPNVTAALHLGHALNNTLQDILIRHHRMRGYETLWMPGTDHAGIATQTVVEKRVLAEEGKKRTDFARPEFVAKIQAFKDEYEQRITEQLKAMGCSCDWDRQRFTMDDVCARAVREAFFRLFKDGLIYRGKRLVNWDPVTQTALADDEVENEEIEGIFAYLRYPLVAPKNPPSPLRGEGRGEGSLVSSLATEHFRPVTWSELAARGYPGADKHPDDDQAYVTVATTRPETYLGDTAVAMNRRDPRHKPLDGLLVELPLVGRVIPIIEDDYVVLPVSLGGDENDPKAKMATGFLKVTPAHDPNDWEIGQRHNLPIINVMAPDASISADHGWDDYDPHHGAHVYVGLSREEARQKVLDEFKARGLLEAVKPHIHSVGHSYRSHAAIEPYLSDQWYVKVTDDRLRGAALRAMTPTQRRSSETKPSANSDNDHLTFHPDRYAKTYETWHENLRDWCISRQLWWGHQIPVWHLDLAQNTPDESSFQNLLDWRESGSISFSGNNLNDLQSQHDSLYVCVAPGHPDIEQALTDAGFTQDPDVLDTWFSSALWPMSTMGWPDPKAAGPEFTGMLDAFNPTSVLTTAREIITLWVSRMVMFNRYLLAERSTKPPQGTDGPVPFHDVFIHAMIQDGQGRKMSKSLGNGVDPLDIIHSHGTDAMRYTLCEMTTQTQDVRLPVEMDEATGRNTSTKFDKGRNFCTKLFNATKFAIMMLDEKAGSEPDAVQPQDLELIDRWMLSRIAGAVQTINESIGSYHFSNYAQSLFDLLRNDFCDWYLEGIKPTLASNAAQRVVLQQSLETILRLLHPLTPFITETLHEYISLRRTGRIGGLMLPEGRNPDLLCTSGWPEADSALIDTDTESRFAHMQSLVEEIRRVRAKHQVHPRRRIALHADTALLDQLSGLSTVTETLAGLATITTAEPAGESVAMTFDSREYALSDLADAVDADTERQRLDEQISDLNKSIAALEKRLANPGYTDKAPKHLVDETRAKLAQQIADRQTAEARLAELA